MKLTRRAAALGGLGLLASPAISGLVKADVGEPSAGAQPSAHDALGRLLPRMNT